MVVGGATLAQPARAQLSGSASVASDYRFRGISLTDGRAAAQAALVYDHASGAYAGAFASNVRLARHSGLQSLGYAGLAWRAGRDLTWDIGAAYSHFTRPDGWDYAEYHVGLAFSDWRARLSYAPRYFGRPYAATYAEIDVSPAGERRWAPLLHIGWLGTEPLEYEPRSRWDVRIGVVYVHAPFTVQLSWGTASHATSGTTDKSAFVLRATTWL